MPANLVYFSQERIALQSELAYHPDVCELVARHAPQEFEMRLAEIAAVFGIVLDGDYYPADLDKLCEILTKKLYERRSSIIIN